MTAACAAPKSPRNDPSDAIPAPWSTVASGIQNLWLITGSGPSSIGLHTKSAVRPSPRAKRDATSA